MLHFAIKLRQSLRQFRLDNSNLPMRKTDFSKRDLPVEALIDLSLFLACSYFSTKFSLHVYACFYKNCSYKRINEAKIFLTILIKKV